MALNRAYAYTVLVSAVVSAAGIGVGSVRAGAIPPAPQAPACANYKMPPELVLNLSNGQTAIFSTFAGTMIGTGKDELLIPGGPRYPGTSNGNLSGSALNITVTWTTGATFGGAQIMDITSKFTGAVGDDGIVRGSAIDNKNARVDFVSRDRLTCADAPAPPPVAAPDKPDEPVQLEPAGQPSAIVNADVDLYDEPGGDGNVIAILREGEKVYLDRPCPPADWCQISGRGWAWGDFLQPK